tara:strand:- start:11636 stop:13618 length:1983 start_codon:yes stop_codon:yes gene_type:complete
MALRKIIEIDVDASGANSEIEKLDKNLGKVDGSSKKADSSLSKVGENGGAIAILDSLTGGLATKIRDAAEASKVFNFSLKGTRTALIATGIGAFVVALGLVVAYWDEIVEFIGGANKKLEMQQSLLRSQSTILDGQLGIVQAQINLAEKQGKSTDSLIKKQTQILNLKKATLLLEISSLETSLLQNEANAEEETFWEGTYITALQSLKLYDRAGKASRDAQTANKEELADLAAQRKAITDLKIEVINLDIALTTDNSKATKGAIAVKAIEDRIKAQEEELALFLESQGFRKKTLEEDLAIQQEAAKKEIAILDEKLRTKKITETAYETEKLKIQKGLLESQANITIENAETELESFIANNQAKLDNEVFFSDESLRIEQERLDAIAQKQKEFTALQLEQGIINQTEYNAAIKVIDDESNAAKDAAQITRDAAEIDRNLINLENKRATEDITRENDFALAYERLEEDRLLEVSEAERTGADVVGILAKYAAQKEQIDELQLAAKLAATSNVLKQVSQLIGEETAAGKAASIAATTIDTYQSATASYKSLAGIPVVGPALGAVAAGLAIANGIATVKKITAVKVPGGASGGGGGGISSANTFDRGGAPTAPAFNVIGQSPESQLAQTLNGQSNSPVRAYVVSREVSSNQELDRNINAEASFG